MILILPVCPTQVRAGLDFRVEIFEWAAVAGWQLCKEGAPGSRGLADETRRRDDLNSRQQVQSQCTV